MKNPQIIFCTESNLNWQAIYDRLKYENSSVVISVFNTVSRAVDFLPETGKWIIVTESVLLDEESEEKVSRLPLLCKAKNPESVVILYTGETYDVDVRLFDHYINNYEKGSYQKLFSFFRRYSS